MRVRILLAVLSLLAALVTALPAPTVAQSGPIVANISRTWERTDGPQVRGDRTFIWGPQPLLPIIEEPLAGVPGGQRAVLYWDKSRMEVNNPAAPQDRWYVTNGLLVSEMVAGRQQVGVNPDAYAQRAPATISFGDLDDPTGPTFASFRDRLADPPLTVGQPVGQALDRAGLVSTTEAGGVVCNVVILETQHCIASPFWAFLNQSGPIYENGRVAEGALFDPLFYATGLPISEAYWVTVKAGGKPTRVLLQLFERRTLTYNPANSAASRVEMGNVGLQYYHWRYDATLPSDPPAGLDPAMGAGLKLIWEASPGYRYLVTNLSGGRYQLIFQDLSSLGADGATFTEYSVILLDNGFLGQDPHNLAGVLAHEAQHAFDLTAGGNPRSANECYALELRGFLTGSALWQSFYGPEGKPAPTNDFERGENAILALLRTNPTRFVQLMVRAYAENCGDLGPGSPDRLLTLNGLPAGIEGQLPVGEAFSALRATANREVSLALAEDEGAIDFRVPRR